MASRHPHGAPDDHSQQYAVPAYNPSDYYIPRAAPADYYAPVAPLSENSSSELGRPVNKDARFAVSAVSPGLPLRPTGRRGSAATILLDRFLGRQPPSPLPLQTSRSPAPQAYLHGTVPAPMRSPGFLYASPPVTPGLPVHAQPNRSQVQVGQSQYFPPPPPGPPPSESRLARMHSVLKEITVPPTEYEHEFVAVSTEAASTAFRQPARGQAPRPLRDRELVAAVPKVPSYPVQKHARFDIPEVPPIKSPPMGKRSKAAPAPIDVQLAEGRASSRRDQPASAPLQYYQHAVPGDIQQAQGHAATRLQDIPRVPQTARLPALRIAHVAPVSPNRGLPLSPLNTHIAKSHPKSVLIDIVLSPSLSPVAANTKSPISIGRNSNSSTPPMWSPQTPRAMSFDFPMIINDSTPPLPSAGWADDRRDTIIEEDVQEQTPMELGPPRGRFSSQQSPLRMRARSMSPPTSAYPKESSFSWDTADLENRHATDEDYYNLDLIPNQMMEDNAYRPQAHGFNPRQTILGSYFK